MTMTHANLCYIHKNTQINYEIFQTINYIFSQKIIFQQNMVKKKNSNRWYSFFCCCFNLLLNEMRKKQQFLYNIYYSSSPLLYIFLHKKKKDKTKQKYEYIIFIINNVKVKMCIIVYELKRVLRDEDEANFRLDFRQKNHKNEILTVICSSSNIRYFFFLLI